jgi:hypothetical protein
MEARYKGVGSYNVMDKPASSATLSNRANWERIRQTATDNPPPTGGDKHSPVDGCGREAYTVK